jgi:hypothetical protein
MGMTLESSFVRAGSDFRKSETDHFLLVWPGRCLLSVAAWVRAGGLCGGCGAGGGVWGGGMCGVCKG